jgi:hypothetical protein
MEARNSLPAYSRLFQDLLFDTARQYRHCGVEISRDINLDALHGVSRIQQEGWPFLTVTLPRLGKALDCALSSGGILDVDGFSRLPNSRLPKFLGCLLSRVFDARGVERPDADVGAVYALRQLTYAFYKLELPFTKEKEAKAISNYLDIEESIGQINFGRPDPVLDTACNIIARVVAGYNPAATHPAHGPGSVATGEEAWEKYRFKRFYPALNKVFGFTEYFVSGCSQISDECHLYEGYDTIDEPTAKVVFVPKDSRGPRTISCEPLELQWVQQGIRRELYRLIQGHELTHGRVNFTRQCVNQYLARVGSLGKGWVTLDMKDASDRVSTALVQRLFQKTVLLESLMASRSTRNLLPDGQMISLKKFAPMGSALCFPVEALVFWALSVSALVEHAGYPLSQAAQLVFVYGDDIVCDSEDCAIILQYLPTLGLKFNESKCCTRGFFRESCGVDAYKGADVTPLKLRSLLPSRQSHVHEILSAIENSNEFDRRGYDSCAFRLRQAVAPLLPIALPWLSHKDPPMECLVFRSHTPKSPCLKRRFNQNLQRMEIRGLVARGVSVTRPRPGWERLLRNLTKLPEGESLLQSTSRGDVWPVRDRVTLKSRWVPCDMVHSSI